MTKPEVVLQPVVREKAAQLGHAGAAWLSGLPELIADLERLWSVTTGEPLTGGTAAYVAPTRTANGRDAVVKLLVPDPAFAGQIQTLAAARGRGYVHLLAHDAQRYAVLLEPLEPSLGQLCLAPEVQDRHLVRRAAQCLAGTSDHRPDRRAGVEQSPRPGGTC
ncbi:MAG: hypothetical protein ACYDC9_04945 [Dermatophilaceae bacterium]